MLKLYNLYEKMKDEFKSASRLMTCSELYNSSMYRDEVSNHLRELGFVCSSSMESTLFFSLVDIVVVVFIMQH